MSRATSVCIILSLLMSIEATGADSAPRLPGLELWLDAANAEVNEPPDKPLSQWRDSSALQRHAVQTIVALQPIRVKVDEAWVLRFDGEDDHLRVLNLDQKLSAFTVFVVAAPHSNQGGFRGLLAFNQADRRDYESGFTLDLGPFFSARLDSLNLEGRGFGGFRSLLKTPSPFNTLQILECVADPTAKRIRLALDGKPQLDRDFVPAEFALNEITIGARYYTNEPNQPQQVRGFFHGDLAEILVYNRVLSDAESTQVRTYLERKHAPLREALPRALNTSRGPDAETLVTVTDPPPVQMLVPGFSVFELPVDLTNINNLRYRSDGKLYALGYNGDVWLLSDADGDGFEETATKYFDSRGGLRGPIGMAVIPAGHALLKSDRKTPSKGVIVPSKGKVSALLDHDGDDVADEERVIASGWKEIVQSVDAIGAAIGPDGSIYFGLGTTAFENAYLFDKMGKAHYYIHDEHGTIQRILPDLSRRETVCTGVRFTIGMDTNGVVNGDGGQADLFVTDQEGATWLPNGNPLDELLHIQPGKHYGFPPRHPKHLPNAVDMPSVFDYGPQHQSTCGMAFNLPRRFALGESEDNRHDALFGPAEWEGNAIVTGESRGKLYRTELVRTENGSYVARNNLIACLSMLTIDCCVSPQGDLVVACHSGGPDWGSGPSGKGKLFKIRYVDKELPQPTAVWCAGPQEIRVAFDRPIDPVHLKNLQSQMKIAYGPYVAAGDRFETIWPGYAVVQMQKMSPRHNLPVRGISIMADRKTLVVATAPHSVAWTYSLTMPGFGRKPSADEPDKTRNPAVDGPPNHIRSLPQHPEVDLAYSLHGVAATWEPKDISQASWAGWLPHLDLGIANGLSVGNAEDDRFWEVIQQPGTLTLDTKLDMRDLIHPAVQPGSKLDHQWPDKEIQIVVRSNRAVVVEGDGKSLSLPGGGPAQNRTIVQAVSSSASQPSRLRISVPTGNGPPSLSVGWTADGFESLQNFALHRMVLPWADTKNANIETSVRQPIPELLGGSWGRGRRVFLSEEAGCAKCHVAQGEAGRIGPDLGNLVHRDYASVLRDVTQPSFALNPDYLSSILTLKDGRVLTGAIRSDGDKLLIGDKDGKVHVITRGDVDELVHSQVSIMPEGMPKKLGPDRMKDLLTYLLTPPPSMPLESPLPPPKPRTRSEVAAILAGAESQDSRNNESGGQAGNDPRTAPRPLTILLVAGAKDHGPGEHDYPAWLRVWKELLRSAEGITVDTAMEWPQQDQISAADTIVFFQKGAWDVERARAMDAHLAQGRGLVYIHWAVEAGAEAPAFAQRIGLASNAARLRFRHGPLDLGFETGKDHPISRNFDKVHFHDESYWQMQGDPARIQILATDVEDGVDQPLFWTLQSGKGRVFVSIPGHFSWTFEDPLFRILLLRGITWTANESVDRLNDLATIGARISED